MDVVIGDSAAQPQGSSEPGRAAAPAIHIRSIAERETPRHRTLSAPVDLAVAAEPRPDGEVLVHVTFLAPSDVSLAYRSLHEAIAVLVDVPELGLTGSALLLPLELQRADPGPNWLGVRPPAPDEVVGRLEGWCTAGVRVVGLERPATAWVRAAFRDRLSAACRVDLRPAPVGPT
jgi:hypothetical protein